RCFFLACDRVAAARRIDARCVTMLRRGLLRETAELLASGALRPHSMPSRAIGYRQTIEFFGLLVGNSDSADGGAIAEESGGGGGKSSSSGGGGDAVVDPDIATLLPEFALTFAARTRQYAHAQFKWFRGEKGRNFVW
ncbi:unnamed protein product, partial [Phaeothamnion confervicola]